MSGITQFEVYVLQHGRWTIHARFPGEERKEAILDARTTEASTHFPTKVVRETYFPDINDSERVTVYLSPNAKVQATAASPLRRAPMKAARAVAKALNRPRSQPHRPALSGAQVFFRVIVAGGVSIASATLITGIVALALRRLGEIGVDMAPDLRTTLLALTYVAAFLGFFWSLFRSRLPLHRLLADLWQKAALPTPTVSEVRSGKPPPIPAQPIRPPSAEALREQEDLKVKRGDAEFSFSFDAPAPETGEGPAPQPEAQVPPKVDPPVPTPPPPVAQPSAEPAPKPADKVPPTPEVAGTSAEIAEDALNLGRTVLRRFVTEVVAPAVKSAMPDDPVARRGAALALTGGAATIAAAARLDARAESELLGDGLTHLGMTRGAIELFMSQRNQQTASPANSMLLAAGRRALSNHLEGGMDIVPNLARALAHWRTPMGQYIDPQTDTADIGDDAAALREVYLLTELREPERIGHDDAALDALHDQAMGAHNGIVRAALANHGGHEIKHTGKGIFARFVRADAATDTATAIQRHFAEKHSTIAIGLIGNAVADDDPLLAETLVQKAQAVTARAGAGEILCEPEVQAASRRLKYEAAIRQTAGAEEVPGLVRLALPEADFEAKTSQPGTSPTLH